MSSIDHPTCIGHLPAFHPALAALGIPTEAGLVVREHPDGLLSCALLVIAR
jgi:hypothetical protein